MKTGDVMMAICVSGDVRTEVMEMSIGKVVTVTLHAPGMSLLLHLDARGLERVQAALDVAARLLHGDEPVLDLHAGPRPKGA